MIEDHRQAHTNTQNQSAQHRNHHGADSLRFYPDRFLAFHLAPNDNHDEQNNQTNDVRNNVLVKYVSLRDETHAHPQRKEYDTNRTKD